MQEMLVSMASIRFARACNITKNQMMRLKVLPNPILIKVKPIEVLMMPKAKNCTKDSPGAALKTLRSLAGVIFVMWLPKPSWTVYRHTPSTARQHMTPKVSRASSQPRMRFATL